MTGRRAVVVTVWEPGIGFPVVGRSADPDLAAVELGPARREKDAPCPVVVSPADR